MSKYSMVMSWSEEDQAYIVSVPELPGCMADGKTPEEAVKNTEIIIQEWIETALEEGEEIPEPHLFSMPVQIRGDIMSNRERIIELLDVIPDYKIGYVLAYVQGVAADEEADDAFCQRMVENYENAPDEDKEGIPLEDCMKEWGLA